MKNTILYIAVFTAVISLISFTPEENSVYMFSYFKNDGKDGLHLAYSYDGYNWKALNNDSTYLIPTVSKDKLMRDPCIIQGKDGLFHMVWTVSWNDRGIGYASSPDLRHWSEQKYIPVMEKEKNARNCWAPEIFYDEVQDLYMIYWATTVTGQFLESDSTSESGYNHRIFYTTTKDFKEFSESKLLYNQGFSVIDAVIRKYGDTYYMFLKDETKFPNPEKNLRIATSKYMTHSYSTPTNPITPDGIWVEGPTIEKVGANYIIYFDMYKDYRMGAIKSDNLTNWTDISDNVSFPPGTRHGSVFKVSKDILEKLK